MHRAGPISNICSQIMADILTVKEHIGRYEDVKVSGTL
jgi:ornithine carbamoyltransferase